MGLNPNTERLDEVKILIFIHIDDQSVKETISFLTNNFIRKKTLGRECLIFFIEEKWFSVGDFVWKLKGYSWKYPESVQVFFRQKDDYRYRTVNMFPNTQKDMKSQDSRLKKKYPFHFKSIDLFKPPNWDKDAEYLTLSSSGWIKCPGCKLSFKTYDLNRIMHDRHHCGQKIFVKENV